MADETIALAQAFNHSFALKHDFQKMLGFNISLLMITHSKVLFDIITGNIYTTEKRLMVNIAAVREAYNQVIISNISLHIFSELFLRHGGALVIFVFSCQSIVMKNNLAENIYLMLVLCISNTSTRSHLHCNLRAANMLM